MFFRFEHILKTKGIYTLGYFQFVKWNLLLLPSIVIVVAGILMLELYVIFIKWKGMTWYILTWTRFIKDQKKRGTTTVFGVNKANRRRAMPQGKAELENRD